MSVPIVEFTETLNEELKKYTTEVYNAINDAVDEVSENLVKELKKNSPVDKTSKKKHYKNSWKVETTGRMFYKKAVVHNKKYRLTHLLEYGHAKVNGGRVKAYPHIASAEQNAIKEFIQKVEEAVSG